MATARMVCDYPLGVGAGNWKLVIPAYSRYFVSSATFETRFFTRPHNDFLWVLAETSVPGLLFYAGFFIYALAKAVSKGRTVIFTGIVGYIVFASFSFPMERAFLAMVSLVLIALAVREYDYKPIRGCGNWLLIVLVLCFAGVDFWYRHIANCQAKAVRATRNPMVWQNILKDISWFAAMDCTTTPLHCFRGMTNYELRKYKEALEDFQTACRVSPNNTSTLAVTGAAMVNAKRFDEAEHYTKRALAIKPDFDKARNNLKHIPQGR